MNEVPPYSPTARPSEQGRLPHDFQIHTLQDDEVDPLDSLVRWKSNALPSPSYASRADASSLPLSEELNPLTHATTAPPFLAPPPRYAPIDALAHTFRIDAPLIYATKTSNTPRYQLMQEFTRSGRPRQIHIRRLMAAEARSHSLPSSTLSSPPPERMRYDEDGTMYTITTYEMRGLRSSTLGGSIRFEAGGGVLGGKWFKIWHYTKNRRRDSLNPENERRMQKYGYRADEEWDKRLLFHVKRGIWEDEDGRKLAVEDGENFEIVGARAREMEGSGWRRDLLVSAWVMRMWMGEGVRWENDVKGW